MMRMAKLLSEPAKSANWGQNPLPHLEFSLLAGNVILLVQPGFVESEIAVGAHWLVFGEIGFAFRTIPRHEKPLNTNL